MEFFKQNIIPGEVLAQLLAFIIVFLVLRAFAWKPILKALEARAQRIREEFERIDHAKKEIENLKGEYTAHLQKIDDEARSKIQEAIEEGRRIAREIQEKARHEAQQTFEKSKENLAIEMEKARVTLRREIASLAIQVAEKVVQEKMTEEKHQEKALEIIQGLEKGL